MMAGAGLDPRRGLLPPFMRTDSEGLDTVLERMESAQERYGERFTPPTILRRLVAQGASARRPVRLLPLPAARRRAAAEVIKLETRADGVAIAWAGQRPDELDLAQVAGDLERCGRRFKQSGVRALVIASSNPFLYSAAPTSRPSRR